MNPASTKSRRLRFTSQLLPTLAASPCRMTPRNAGCVGSSGRGAERQPAIGRAVHEPSEARVSLSCNLALDDGGVVTRRETHNLLGRRLHGENRQRPVAFAEALIWLLATHPLPCDSDRLIQGLLLRQRSVERP